MEIWHERNKRIFQGSDSWGDVLWVQVRLISSIRCSLQRDFFCNPLEGLGIPLHNEIILFPIRKRCICIIKFKEMNFLSVVAFVRLFCCSIYNWHLQEPHEERTDLTQQQAYRTTKSNKMKSFTRFQTTRTQIGQQENSKIAMN